MIDTGKIRRVARSALRTSPWRTALATRASGRVAVGRGTRLLGAGNVTVQHGLLKLGTGSYDLADSRTPGLVNVEGRLVCDGSVAVGQGAQWRVHPGAVAHIGEGTYINTFSIVDVAAGLTVGARCSIAWQVQFIDDDMHSLRIGGQPRPRSAPIVVGDDVWIGSRVTLLKGAYIAPGCVIAAGSVVGGRFEEANCLIGGTPARVLRKDVSWSQD